MTRIKVSLTANGLFLAVVASTAFIFSMIIAPFHVGGDQVHYTKAYYSMRGLNLVDGLHSYSSKIFSLEPVHFIVSWLFVNMGFDKTIAMSALNGLAAGLVGRLFLIRTGSYVLVTVLILTNQYLYAMFFTLEKLKISIIFLLLFLNFRLRLFGLLAALAHLQIALLFAIYFAASNLARANLRIFPRFIKFRNVMFKAALAVFFGFCGLFFFDYAFAKVSYYVAREGVGALSASVPAILVGVITCLATEKNRKIVVWYYAILAVLIFLIGGDRVNMFALFGFYYFAANQRKPEFEGIVFFGAFALIALYLGYKSYNYLYTIINFGG